MAGIYYVPNYQDQPAQSAPSAPPAPSAPVASPMTFTQTLANAPGSPSNVAGEQPNYGPSTAPPGSSQLHQWLNANGPYGAPAAAQEQLGNLTQGPGAFETMKNFMFEPSNAPLVARQNAANFYGLAAAQKHLAANPDALAAATRDPVGYAPTLAAYLDASSAQRPTMATHVGSNGVPFAKQMQNPDKINAIAQATGANPSHVTAMMEPHQYTDQELTDAFTGMPWIHAEKLWNMQHYLNPQQQISASYFGLLQDHVSKAGMALQAAQQSGNAGQIKAAQNAFDQSQSYLQNELRLSLLGQTSLYGNAAPPQE